jgi:class 3 adenylate cyclase
MDKGNVKNLGFEAEPVFPTALEKDASAVGTPTGAELEIVTATPDDGRILVFEHGVHGEFVVAGGRSFFYPKDASGQAKYLDALAGLLQKGFVRREGEGRYCYRLTGRGFEVRKALKSRALDAFVVSAKGATSSKSFQDWAGGERVTLAIVFTDVVGSTALGGEIRDEAMNEVRRAHFAQSRKLINQFKGREIKTIGDSFMAAFKNVDAALDYALALQRDTGHPQVQIRAGIHIGPMQVEADDVFGGTVDFAARVVGAIEGAEIRLSERAKEDIDSLGGKGYAQLQWHKHPDVALKGFADKFTLWSVAA